MSTPRFTVSLDWDDTFTKSPRMWEAFVRMLATEKPGARLVLVTMRYEDEGQILREWAQAVNDMYDMEFPVEVYFTGRKAKKPFMEALGVPVDIWIDDAPHWVLGDAAG